jgi:hypothetical protein
MAAGRPGPPLVLTRDGAIAALRRRLERLGNGEHSTCHVAAERGIFCRGFRRWDDHEFHRRWSPVLGQSTHLNRPQLERLADLWELCEQVGRHARVACDARAAEPGPCRGWYEFSDETLGRFCSELLGRPVSVEMGNDSFASGATTASREIKRTQET